MTYKLAFNESALKEWKKLGHTIQEQFKKKFAHPPYPNWTAVGVTWLAGFDFEIKVIARIP
ncbi:hypothetical protein IMB06_000385 [Salmonella enterica]|nr:hypothetical protein [Salmonella enterica]